MVIDTLKIFVTVVEQSHFSNAAKVLNMSQPGVSLHIRNLENEFGVQLIHRSPKHVKMTEAGEILYHSAKQMLEQYEYAKQQIHLLRDEVSGTIRVGASYTIGEYILPKMIAAFTQSYPLVDIQPFIANTEEIIHALRAKDLDVGLVEGSMDTTDLQVVPFMEDEMVLVTSVDHHLNSAKEVEPELLHHQVWIMRETGSGTRSYCEQYIKDLQLEVKRSFVFNSNQGVKEAVKAGLGIAILSHWVVNKELEASELCSIAVRGPRVTRQFSMVQDPKITASLALERFLQRLRQL